MNFYNNKLEDALRNVSNEIYKKTRWYPKFFDVLMTWLLGVVTECKAFLKVQIFFPSSENHQPPKLWSARIFETYYEIPNYLDILISLEDFRSNGREHRIELLQVVLQLRHAHVRLKTSVFL